MAALAMSVAVCSAVTEVEQVEISPPNAKPRPRGRKLVEDEATGKLQLELLERVEDVLRKLLPIILIVYKIEKQR